MKDTEVEVGDDAEVVVAAFQCSEEIGITGCVGADDAPVCYVLDTRVSGRLAQPRHRVL